MPGTERLYYRDSFLREFDARVLRVEAGEGGRCGVVLDRTAFYPTSGGQPHDLGALGDSAVEDVRENDAGEVVHVVARAPVGTAVRGTIDWPRRFDHMQQHSGQHLLSAAFVRLFTVPTVSFHLGRDICTIDLEAASLGPQQLEQAEELANRVIFEDRPVQIRFASPGELEAQGMRKAPARQGELRLIDIEDFDRCPCGGTHVARTGQIGLVLLWATENLRGQVRVEFVCGGRALAAARGDYKHLQEAARLLTTGAAELPAVLRKQQEEQRAARQAHGETLERLAELEAGVLLAAAEAIGGRRLLVKVFEGAEADYLRRLGARLVREPNVQLLLAAKSPAAAVVFAQSPGGPADMNALLRETVGALGGKGGGSRDFAQGVLPEAARVEEALTEARRRLRE